MKLTSTLLGVVFGALAISNAAANPVVNVINVQTDAQNVPIDRVGHTHKILILLMSH